MEKAKIRLAAQPAASIPLDWIGEGVAVELTQADLAERTAALASRISARVATCLKLAGLRADDIEALFLTGGSTRLAQVRRAIIAELLHARVIEGDTFGSVGVGLSIEAGRRFGPGRDEVAVMRRSAGGSA